MREDILGALRSALIRKESLEQAIVALINAGYKQKDIEESARALYRPVQPIKPVGIKKFIPIQSKPKVPQQISNYSKSKPKKMLIVLIFSLIILFGILIGLFLFRQEIIEFLNRILN